jgi:hypothetical protein
MHRIAHGGSRRVFLIQRNRIKRILAQLATRARSLVPRFGIVLTALDGFMMRTGMTIHEWTPLKGGKVMTEEGRQRTAVSGSKDWKSSDT